MSESWEDYLEAARRRAREAASEQMRRLIQANRQAERQLARRSLGRPFDDLTLADVESMRRTAQYARLAVHPEFQARVQLLEEESRQALESVRDAEEEAVERAIVGAPPKMRLLHRHEREYSALLARHRVDDLEDAPAHVRQQVQALKEEHVRELQTLTASS